MAEISTEMDTNSPEGSAWLAGTVMTSECIAIRTNIDGTLDYVPLPLGMRNIWLFNNGGERNDVC